MSKYSRPLYVQSPQIYGKDVEDVQSKLTSLGYSLGSIDGYYGPKTESAVKKYQKDNKLEVDGVVGPKTWESLFNKDRVLYLKSPQMYGEDVEKVQKKLKELGYNVGDVDGYYGPKTESAVKKYQKDNKLEVDGMVGPKTKKSLENKKMEEDTEKDRVLYVKSPQMHGEDVKKVQKKLKELGYSVGDIDGYYGLNTESGVRRFQKINKLEIDGMVGPNTSKKLFSNNAKPNEEKEENRPVKPTNPKNFKIYIDSGHGGNDPGASGNGLIEKKVVLQISKYQQELFEEMGYKVKMSRDNDSTMSLSSRTNEANKWGADLFISNHCNAFNGSAHGSETYYSVFSSEGKKYAQSVADALSNIFRDRGAKTRTTSSGKDYYHVIRETNMPSIIIEYAFIDNKNDSKYLDSNKDLKELAILSVNAIVDVIEK